MSVKVRKGARPRKRRRLKDLWPGSSVALRGGEFLVAERKVHVAPRRQRIELQLNSQEAGNRSLFLDRLTVSSSEDLPQQTDVAMFQLPLLPRYLKTLQEADVTDVQVSHGGELLREPIVLEGRRLLFDSESVCEFQPSNSNWEPEGEPYSSCLYRQDGLLSPKAWVLDHRSGPADAVDTWTLFEFVDTTKVEFKAASRS